MSDYCVSLLQANAEDGLRGSIITGDGKILAKSSVESQRLYPFGKSFSPALGYVISKVNKVARGWRNYFYYGNCSKSMQKMDNYLQSRVRIFLRRKHRVQTIGYKRFPTEFLHNKLGLYKIPAQAPWTKL